jgi:hypothetical protein
VCRAARSGQGRVLCGGSEPLTARTDLSPFRQEGKGAVDLFFYLSSVFASRPNRPCRHPSIRTLSERFIRSVQVGCSRCSRRCHLIFDLGFHLAMEVGRGLKKELKARDGVLNIFSDDEENDRTKELLKQRISKLMSRLEQIASSNLRS